MRYRDRADAGRRLAKAVERRLPAAGAVVSLSTGSRAVAEPVADALGTAVFILAARPVEVGDALHPVSYVGAVGPCGALVLHPDLLRHLDLSSDALRAAVGVADVQLDPAASAWPPDRLTGPVVVVDDGTASTAELRAAIDVIAPSSACPIVVASPLLSRDAVEELTALGCDVIADQVLPWVEWFALHERFYENDQRP